MFQRVLLAIDKSPSSQVGVSFASALALEHGAPIHVFHVNEILIGGRGLTASTPAEANHLVESALAQLRDAGVEATGAVRLGTVFNVPGRIVDAAHGWSADTIVMGSKRHRHFGRLRGQGVRERVARLTPLPLLIAPAPLRISSRARSQAGQLAQLDREFRSTPSR